MLVLVLLGGKGGQPATCAEGESQFAVGEPLTPRRQASRPTSRGIIQLYDGSTFQGNIYLTWDKEFLIYDRALKQHTSIPLLAVKHIEVVPEEERLEREWRWKQEGSDEKVYTGRTYPWRKYVTTLKLVDGRCVSGDLSALVYLRDDKGKEHKFILHKRQKGKVGTSLAQLKYVKTVVLGVLEAWGEPVAGLRAGIWSEKDTFQVGEPIMVRSAIKNLSLVKQTIWVSGFSNQRFDLERSNGKEVKLSSLGLRARSAFDPRGARDKNASFSLKPGQTFITSQQDLTKLFDLSAPGRYNVRYSYESYHQGWKGKLTSSTLVINVVPKEQQELEDTAGE